MQWACYWCSEFRHVARSLLREPGFVLAVVLTIALGGSPAVVVLSAVRAVALPPIPYVDPESLVVLSRIADDTHGVPWSVPKFEMFRDGVTAADLTACGYVPMRLSPPGEMRQVRVETVASNYFSVLRARPRLGRTFRSDENAVPLGNPIAVLSERLWRQRFGAREDAVGQTLRLNGRVFTVVGVMPEAFKGASLVLAGWPPPDLWVPLMMAPAGVPDERAAAMILETPYGQWIRIGCLSARRGPGNALPRAQIWWCRWDARARSSRWGPRKAG